MYAIDEIKKCTYMHIYIVRVTHIYIENEMPFQYSEHNGFITYKSNSVNYYISVLYIHHIGNFNLLVSISQKKGRGELYHLDFIPFLRHSISHIGGYAQHVNLSPHILLAQILDTH